METISISSFSSGYLNDKETNRWRVEGSHGEAKTQHGLRRAVRRGTANVAIQVYLTAAVMNLKRLAASLRTILAICDARRAAYQLYDTDSSTPKSIRQFIDTEPPASRTAA